MPYPDLLNYKYEDEYRDHFKKVYCSGPIVTFDGIEVRFRMNDFLHLFYKENHSDRKRDVFVYQRAERLEWIKAALEDDEASLFFGWDTAKRRVFYDRRVAVVQTNYCVIVNHTDVNKANIITAFVLDQTALEKVRKNEYWDTKKVRY